MSFWNLWRNKDDVQLNSKEYESVTKKIIEFSARIEELENKFKILGTNYDNLRGQFNRKLSGIAKEEEKVAPKEEEMTNETNIKPCMFLNPNGLPI